MKNVGLVTYSTSEYFRQNWLEVLNDKFNNLWDLAKPLNNTQSK